MSDDLVYSPLSTEQKPCCDYFKEGATLIDGPIINQTVRSGGRYKYTGRPFRFCPWCGKELPKK